MRFFAFVILCSTSSWAWAQACLVKSTGDNIEVRVCQQNRTIPANLFREGFCQPNLKGQQVEVTFVDQCPIGAYAICRNATTGGVGYRQDIHYYGIASDARLLKPYCEKQAKGVWTAY